MALSAIRCEPSSEACYERLTADAKQHKLALVAGLRRLAGLLDTILQEDRTRRPEPPSRELKAAARNRCRPAPDPSRPGGEKPPPVLLVTTFPRQSA